jgi:hypothetical protein
MASDLSEHDLYPPDVERPTPDQLQHRKRVVVGTALVVWGMSLLVQRALGVDFDSFWLGIGLAALVGWSQVPRYSWFIAGAVGTGVGVAALVAPPLGNAFGTSVSNLLIGLGFAAVYVRYPRRSSWALAVAGVFALIAVGAFGIGLIGLVPAMLGRFLLPLLLIGGGALLLARHSLPPKAVKVGLASLAAAFVVVGATSIGDVDHRPPMLGRIPPAPLTSGQPLGDLGDQTLVLHGQSGDVRFERSSDGLARVQAVDGDGDPRMGVVVVRQDGSNVTVDARRDADLIVSLPDGVELDVVRSSGDVTGKLAGARGSIRTDSGDVDLELEDGGAEGFRDDGPLDIEADSGSVTIDSELLLDLDLGSDGDVMVNRVNENGRYRSPAGVSGMELEVDTDSGDIEIDMPDVPEAPEAPTAPTAPSSSSD